MPATEASTQHLQSRGLIPRRPRASTLFAFWLSPHPLPPYKTLTCSLLSWPAACAVVCNPSVQLHASQRLLPALWPPCCCCCCQLSTTGHNQTCCQLLQPRPAGGMQERNDAQLIEELDGDARLGLVCALNGVGCPPPPGEHTNDTLACLLDTCAALNCTLTFYTHVGPLYTSV
jgi:hypothetical protein